MVLFRNSASIKPLEGDAPRLLRMTPLHHSLRVSKTKADRKVLNGGSEEDAHSDAGSTASAPGFTGVKDLSLWNKGISQRWRRLRRRCTSFTTGSTVSNYIASPNHHRESLLDLDASSDSPVIRRSSNNGSNGAVMITPRRVMSPSKENGLYQKQDAVSLDGSFLSPKPPKSKSSSEKIFPEVQQMLRTKFSRIHAGLRKRRAVSIHEVQSNRNEHPIFYVPSPLNSSSSHHGSIHNIDERDDENEDDAGGHLSLPPFAFRDLADKPKDVYRKFSGVCSSEKVTDSSDVIDRRIKENCRSKTSGKDINENGDRSWGRDIGYHSIETQHYDRVYCDKWTSPSKDKINCNERLDRFDFIQASEKRNSVKFAATEPVKQIELSTTKFCKARLSEHSKNHYIAASRYSACEPSRNPFLIGSAVTNRFIACSNLSSDSGPPSLPYGFDDRDIDANVENDYEDQNSKKVPSSNAENLLSKGGSKTASKSNHAPSALRNRTRSQSPLKKERTSHYKRSIWAKDTKEHEEREENDKRVVPQTGESRQKSEMGMISRRNLVQCRAHLGGQRWSTSDGEADREISSRFGQIETVMHLLGGGLRGEYEPSRKAKNSFSKDSDGTEEENESKFCTLPRHGKGAGFSILTVTFTKGPGQKGLGFSIVGGRDSPKGSMGIYIKTIFPAGQAAESGALKEGDEILAVNHKPFHGLSHQEAINVFKEIKNGPVQLHIGRRQYRKR